MRTIARNALTLLPLAAMAVGAQLAFATPAGAATGGLGNAPTVIEHGSTSDIVQMAEGLSWPTNYDLTSDKLTIVGSVPAMAMKIDTDFLNQSHDESSHLVVVEVVSWSATANGATDHDAFFAAGQALRALEANQAGPLPSDWSAIYDHTSPDSFQAVQDGFNN